MIFTFKERPVELFEKNIEIKVMDTGKKFRDSALGIFTVCQFQVCLCCCFSLCYVRLMLGQSITSQVC